MPLNNNEVPLSWIPSSTWNMNSSSSPPALSDRFITPAGEKPLKSKATFLNRSSFIMSNGGIWILKCHITSKGWGGGLWLFSYWNKSGKSPPTFCLSCFGLAEMGGSPKQVCRGDPAAMVPFSHTCIRPIDGASQHLSFKGGNVSPSALKPRWCDGCGEANAAAACKMCFWLFLHYQSHCGGRYSVCL